MVKFTLNTNILEEADDSTRTPGSMNIEFLFPEYDKSFLFGITATMSPNDPNRGLCRIEPPFALPGLLPYLLSALHSTGQAIIPGANSRRKPRFILEWLLLEDTGSTNIVSDIQGIERPVSRIPFEIIDTI